MTHRILSICLAAALSLLPLTSHALGKADIAITDITIDNNCYWKVTVKNVGTTQLPVTALDQYNGASISMKVGGANIGFHRFSQGLKMPGSVDYFSLSYSNNPQAQVNGTQSVEASYDTSGSYEDINLANNKLSKTFTCTPPPKPLADLAITSLDFTSDCRIRIKVANLGNAPVDNYIFSAAYLQRKIDNVPGGQLYFRTIDPSGKLKTPQGAVEWTETTEYNPQQTIVYYFDTSTNAVIPDSNYKNNSATVNLPDRCKPGAAIRKVPPQYKGPVQKPIEDKLQQGQKPIPKLP